MSQTNGTPPAVVLSGQKSDRESKPWLYDDGPRELPAEDDDFEGNRNWALILIFAVLAILPVIGLVLMLL